jgi:hypothetical protein
VSSALTIFLDAYLSLSKKEDMYALYILEREKHIPEVSPAGPM